VDQGAPLVLDPARVVDQDDRDLGDAVAEPRGEPGGLEVDDGESGHADSLPDAAHVGHRTAPGVSRAAPWAYARVHTSLRSVASRVRLGRTPTRPGPVGGGHCRGGCVRPRTIVPSAAAASLVLAALTAAPVGASPAGGLRAAA